MLTTTKHQIWGCGATRCNRPEQSKKQGPLPLDHSKRPARLGPLLWDLSQMGPVFVFALRIHNLHFGLGLHRGPHRRSASLLPVFNPVRWEAAQIKGRLGSGKPALAQDNQALPYAETHPALGEQSRRPKTARYTVS